MKLIFKIVFVLMAVSATAQEYLGPLNANINLMYHQPDRPLKNGQTQKITAAGDTLNLPIFEDFYYAANSPYPSAKIWTDSSVYVNAGYGMAPLSLGVATFDGLSKQGYPYLIGGNANMSNSADTLSSRPIFLGSIGSVPYQVSDSIALAFFYQRQGFGNGPEQNDSLVLEFYKPLYPVVQSTTTTTYGKWFIVWSSRGTNTASPVSSDSTFKRAFIPITDTAYLHNGFKFRLRNKAAPTGNVDHWNVDYIRLATNFKRGDTTYADAAFGYVPKMPWLKNYSSMPWWQFNASETDTAFTTFIRNNSDTNGYFNLRYKYDMYSASNTLLYSKDLGSSNVAPFYPHGWDKVSSHRNPGCTYTLSSLSDSTHFTFKHYIVKITNDLWQYNDTVSQSVVLNNYYAYDDGSAEQGWGLKEYGAKTALRFTTNVTDTLRALDIFFNPTYDGNLIQSSGFRLCVWDAGSGQPGNLLRRDSITYPKYYKFGYNQFPRYFFTSPLILSAGTYYVGMQQVTSQTLSIGFDMNYDNRTKLYFDTNGFWEQSQFKGSLMIHPVFGVADRAMVGINEPKQKAQDNIITIYPNPANDKLFVSSNSIEASDRLTAEVYSVIGNKLYEADLKEKTTAIDVGQYSGGIYFIALKQNGEIISYKKFIIAR